jgi:hypothetical protein
MTTSQMAGMTFRFCEALIIVGENVGARSGSTIAAKKLPISSARPRASCGEVGASPVTASSSAVTSGVSRRAGTKSPSFVISAAALTRALSAMPGMDAWPLRPRTRKRNGALIFSATEQM